MLIKEAREITGGLSKPSKMPGPAYNLPASQCITGAKLVNVKGSTCSGCYALKGNYIRYQESNESTTRRLNYLLNYPDKYQAQMYNEMKAKCDEHQALEGYKNMVVIRWNDSGDFFGKKYVK